MSFDPLHLMPRGQIATVADAPLQVEFSGHFSALLFDPVLIRRTETCEREAENFPIARAAMALELRIEVEITAA